MNSVLSCERDICETQDIVLFGEATQGNEVMQQLLISSDVCHRIRLTGQHMESTAEGFVNNLLLYSFKRQHRAEGER